MWDVTYFSKKDDTVFSKSYLFYKEIIKLIIIILHDAFKKEILRIYH